MDSSSISDTSANLGLMSQEKGLHFLWKFGSATTTEILAKKNLHGHINQTIMYIRNNRRSVAVLVGLKVASPKHTSKLNKQILVCNMATNTDSRSIH
jgi:hypothetical protein